MKELLKKLSIVIPTYERHSFAIRAMTFWDGKEPTIYVLDGSKTPIPSDKLKKYSSNIKYFHRPVGLSERFEFICDVLISSSVDADNEYAILQGDDEFYVSRGLEECLRQLESDKGLVTCCGSIVGFRPNTAVGLEGVICYEKLLGYERSELDNKSRSSLHMSNYIQSHIYSVMRKSSWIKCVKSFRPIEFPVYAIYEIQFEMCASFAGRSKVIPHLTWLRSYDENIQISNTETDISFDPKGQRFDSWWRSKDHHYERALFISQMSKAFKSLAPISEAEAEIAVRNISESYVKHLEEKEETVRAFARRLAPSFFKELIRKVRNILSGSKRKMDILEMDDFFSNYNITVDISELTEIRKIILDFHDVNNINQN